MIGLDDIAIVLVGKNLLEIEVVGNEAMNAVATWLHSVGLQLAKNKTEMVRQLNWPPLS